MLSHESDTSTPFECCTASKITTNNPDSVLESEHD
jgi:hypothetical protein